MNVERLRKLCLSLPGATETVQWGNDLVFKIGGKMFAVTALDAAAPVRVSFKCSDERLAEFLEVDGIIPAPYLARAKWVAMERFDALSDREIEAAVSDAYELVKAKLPKKQQAAIGDRRRSAGTRTGGRTGKRTKGERTRKSS